MSYLRAAIATLLALILGIIIFMLVSFGTDDEIASITRLYLEGNYREAEFTLERLEKSLPPAQAALFYAYLAKGQEDPFAMTEELKKARQEKGWEQVSEEVSALELLQAFEHRDEIGLKNLLGQIPQSHPWHSYFANILRGWDMQDNALAAPISSPPPILSVWNGKLVHQDFTTSWIADFNLEIKIDKGDYLGARRDLARYPSSPSKEYLMGLTYLKEALAKPADLSQPYLEQAFSSFEMSSIYHPNHRLERKQIVRKLLEQASRLNQNNTEEREQIALWLEKLEAFPEAKALRIHKNTPL